MEPIQLADTILGQYIGRDDVPKEDESAKGYKDDPTVPSDSKAPTFALAVARINNERWDGVPFFLRLVKL